MADAKSLERSSFLSLEWGPRARFVMPAIVVGAPAGTHEFAQQVVVLRLEGCGHKSSAAQTWPPLESVRVADCVSSRARPPALA